MITLQTKNNLQHFLPRAKINNSYTTTRSTYCWKPSVLCWNTNPFSLFMSATKFESRISSETRNFRSQVCVRTDPESTPAPAKYIHLVPVTIRGISFIEPNSLDEKKYHACNVNIRMILQHTLRPY